MKTDETKQRRNQVNQLINNLGDELREKKYINPQYFRENMDYFRRQAELMN